MAPFLHSLQSFMLPGGLNLSSDVLLERTLSEVCASFLHADKGQVAILDDTNTTMERRNMLLRDQWQEPG